MEAADKIANAREQYAAAKSAFDSADRELKKYRNENPSLRDVVMFLDGRAYVRCNAMNGGDPTLHRLCRLREKARQDFCSALRNLAHAKESTC